jgi:predicted DNA-binding transcriptional regulator AlpA
VKKGDLVPYKVVLAEMGVSRNTMWRAARSNIAGFPPPIVIRRLVFWKRGDLERLEEALMRYQGRCAFERQRSANKKVASLKKTKANLEKPTRKRSAKRLAAQMDLFGRGGA